MQRSASSVPCLPADRPTAKCLNLSLVLIKVREVQVDHPNTSELTMRRFAPCAPDRDLAAFAILEVSMSTGGPGGVARTFCVTVLWCVLYVCAARLCSCNSRAASSSRVLRQDSRIPNREEPRLRRDSDSKSGEDQVVGCKLGFGRGWLQQHHSNPGTRTATA